MRILLMTAACVLGWAVNANAQLARSEPVCKADQAGNVLVTTIQYDDGYRVDGPWRVSSAGRKRGVSRITATLDHIVETDPFTNKRQLTPLPGPIEMTFEANSSGRLLEEAASVWCETVTKALAVRPTESLKQVSQGRRIM